MGLRDSREQLRPPRWGIEDGSDIPSANVAEPLDQQKDLGLENGVNPFDPAHYNWLLMMNYLFIEYIEGLWGNRWTVNHIIPAAAATAGEVTAGGGMSVDVQPATVWIGQAQFQIETVSNVAIPAADPTLNRTDLVVFGIPGGVPTIEVVTGTPAAGAPTAPTAGPLQVPLALVSVPAAISAVALLIDVRRFGAVRLDQVIASMDLLAGDQGGSWLLELLSDGAAQTIKMGPDLLHLDAVLSRVEVDPEALRFFSPQPQRLTIAPSKFAELDGSSTNLSVTNGSRFGADPVNDKVACPLDLPVGAVITGFTVWGNRASAADGLVVDLRRIIKATGAASNVVTASNVGSGPTDFELVSSAIAHPVNEDSIYYLHVDWGGSGGGVTSIFAVEVRYTILTPYKAP